MPGYAGVTVWVCLCRELGRLLLHPLHSQKTHPMFKNYLRMARRSLGRNKVFSFINMIGLSIGISASLVIYLIVSYDFGFDKGEKEGDRIYRVVSSMVFSGEPVHSRGLPMPLASAIQKDLTGLDGAARLYTADPMKVSVPLPAAAAKGAETAATFKDQTNIVYANADYFHIIGYDWLAGTAATSLTQPYTVVLTVSQAALYFPGLPPESIVGRRLYFNDSVGTAVTGVVKDLPYHSEFSFQTFISQATLDGTSLRPPFRDFWGATSSSATLLVKLSPGETAAGMEGKINALYKKDAGDSYPKNGNKSEYLLQPLRDMHFNHFYGNYYGRSHLAHKPTLYGLLITAALLLALACINFINLTTAQAGRRAKEIGIRKTIGSSRRQLIFQFLGETFVLTLIAIVCSILLTPLLLKVFADFIPAGVHFDIIREPGILAFGVLLLFGVCLLSGFYPALVLSAYKPVLVLKNQLQAEGGPGRRLWLRKTLTVSQFVIAQVFIIGTLLVTKQISYTLHKDLGFRRDAIGYLQTNERDISVSRRIRLLAKLREMPGITGVSLSSDIPSSNGVWSNEVKYTDGKKDLTTVVQMKAADTNFCRLYEIRILAGADLPFSDTLKGVLINETYLHTLGFRDPREVLGKRLDWGGGKMVPVIGVVADFHEQSLHTPIKPLALVSDLSNEKLISVSLSQEHLSGPALQALLAKMKTAWASIYPADDFDWKFQDETLVQFYQGEQNIARLLSWATGLMLFISCLGLLGLVIYITHQRTKEIGIRKIVGASVAQIIVLLSADFLKLLAWAFLIAVPLAWWGANSWLNGFAYRTGLSGWIFVTGGLIMGIVSGLILLLRTFRAALANPAKSLRTE